MSQPVPLGEICEFKYGKSLPASKRVVGGVSVYGSNGVVGEHNEGLTTSPAIVIGRKGSIGAISYSSASCWPIDTTYYVDETATSEDIRWLYHALKQLRLDELNKATGVPGLNRNDAYQQRLVRPPLDEQRRIAAILDKADAIRRKREQALTLADDLLKSAFLEMFGDPISNPNRWRVRPLGASLEDIRYGTSAKCGDTQSEGSVPILRIPNVVGEAVNWMGLKYAELSTADWLRLELLDGDILFVRSNGNPEYIGRCAVFESKEPAAFASYLIRARLKADAEVTPQFVAKAISMPSFRHRILKDAKTTAGNYNINTKALKALPIICPPEELQARYQRISNQVATWTTKSTQALAEAETLFASLSQRAFRGEL